MNKPRGDTWAHLHLPRLTAWREGRGDDKVISVKKLGRKIDYASAAVLTGVQFVVSEAGRQRCLRQRVRNVHAWVVGTDITQTPAAAMAADDPDLRKAIYDPWKGGAFVDAETLRPVHTAEMALLVGKDVYYR